MCSDKTFVTEQCTWRQETKEDIIRICDKHDFSGKDKYHLLYMSEIPYSIDTGEVIAYTKKLFAMIYSGDIFTEGGKNIAMDIQAMLMAHPMTKSLKKNCPIDCLFLRKTLAKYLGKETVEVKDIRNLISKLENDKDKFGNSIAPLFKELITSFRISMVKSLKKEENVKQGTTIYERGIQRFELLKQIKLQNESNKGLSIHKKLSEEESKEARERLTETNPRFCQNSNKQQISLEDKKVEERDRKSREEWQRKEGMYKHKNRILTFANFQMANRAASKIINPTIQAKQRGR